ncbi:hypothetical protein A3H10_04550 [Candidatus Uhrbacteria bacterium RIFCSPLOWO2_12_FULL_46_10]|uniref:PD-(D/E)XK endonuclease-like domain-containing protein n=1 Tax=Candidatus Uhrbacteria bacterium RIFCSPLOWO2_01_FULL_47_25 TaxID=1802402 RepID=A0A1F7UXU9_9BACT|nr:MAG: hypothetical protein UX68_C0006G0015 [Parcubacteria group bacterium GW2011_GWA2_46_9]OGL59367.1 MAG: hypothetical protein A2752_05415 [Candidatus Uhrbacteria bacterium RIFCSPHIGHO2_01_FULL_46_23]OGL69002.1 MAG: hypothetical protein A3D60_04470 [Candidatus Uhrbacteria bacterium RIFCSPHIGHO2_02_FULL_47_29]OGL75937.1 MAG: hypothetical protein A3E96_03725 [Candidatus Uhrbacteria bacterium RIFCSPHIGHO2_12_FULL_46_13]OGL82487.1 MAG: hypothetical protein A2936_02410 [Candidatus Uhrbacteria bac
MFNKKNHHTSLFPDQAANNSQTQGKPLRLSPTSGLNLYNDCTRCFWLHYNGRVPRPRGIFPSLPGGMDLVIKDYFDEYRGALPPELKGRVKGELMPDLDLMNQWRNWRTGLEYRDQDRNAVLFGALDECLVHEGKYVPLDYKTRGSAPNDGDSERYYQTQLDSYALMLQANGYPVADFAYLVYYYPERVGENGAVKFNVHPVELSLDARRAKNTFEEAVDLLQKPLPNRRESCEYCSWHKNMGAFSL